ncbi:hypothetical protein [Hymenobacter lucidus]|uniref:DUF5723 domain-containing protein n=1 Tax=Hymenobacter lucidus TaxID=2880930 RepID=A0ABS8ANI4_9BACT|nr:hypothetical protein [Hymenobacter lucidus]MCB2406861.1 hypothetical protein [Hymenobacter lucidus]
MMRNNYSVGYRYALLLLLLLIAQAARAQSSGLGFVIPKQPLALVEDSVDKAYFIPVQYTGEIPKDSVLVVQVLVLKSSTAQVKEDFELDAEPLLLAFSNKAPKQQYIRLVVKADTLTDTKESVTLLLQGQGKLSAKSIITSDDRITVAIGDISERKEKGKSYLEDFNYPLRFSIGTNLNVIDKEKVGGNIYFDLMALDQDMVVWPSARRKVRVARKTAEKTAKLKAETPPRTYVPRYRTNIEDTHFGGYFRVVQQQGVAVVNDSVAPARLQRTTISQLGRVAADQSVSVDRQNFNYALASTTVRSSGVTLGVNKLLYTSPASAQMECKMSLGLQGELIKREILNTYERTLVLRDTIKMTRDAYLKDAASGDFELEQRLNSFDGYFGVSSTVLYRFGNLELIAIPSVGFVGTTLADNGPKKNFLSNNFYMNVYAVITERKFGFTLGCDLKSVPGNNTINSFNIFANKAFSLEKIAEALRFD